MNQRLILSTALASVLAMGMLSSVNAADTPAGKEKCFGIAKAGQNDCANLSGTHSCAGQHAHGEHGSQGGREDEALVHVISPM